ncbi:MAG: hypothetical protein RBS80_03380 [Thermoguttaceae bacterium]|nr:hypothetical protein [Thermoguttaceae bacterium]
MLRVSPVELGRLGKLARAGEAGSADELLAWMIDHVEGRQHRKASRRAGADS